VPGSVSIMILRGAATAAEPHDSNTRALASDHARKRHCLIFAKRFEQSSGRDRCAGTIQGFEARDGSSWALFRR
jgi:hypothetical protein